tara:strand:- start:917 stop:1177 length:261 start_codon:yes stop_codon:yes gene_type:complete
MMPIPVLPVSSIWGPCFSANCKKLSVHSFAMQNKIAGYGVCVQFNKSHSVFHLSSLFIGDIYFEIKSLSILALSLCHINKNIVVST